MSTLITEVVGDTLLVKASRNLRELHSRSVEGEGETLLRRLDDPSIKNAVFDLSGTDYYGSSALNLFLKIERKLRLKRGQLVFVGLSPHELEILHVTGLESRWTICKSRDEALSVLGHMAHEV